MRVAASAITERAAELHQSLKDGALRRSQLDGLLDSVTQGGTLVERAMSQSASWLSASKACP
jgi:hypothetical protein